MPACATVLRCLWVIVLAFARQGSGAELALSPTEHSATFATRIDGPVPDEIHFQDRHTTRRHGNRLDVDTRIVDQNIGTPHPDIEPMVRHFFKWREAARAVVAELPSASLKAPPQIPEEYRQCMAFNLAGSLLADEFIGSAYAGMAAEKLDDLIARTHTYIAENLFFINEAKDNAPVERAESPLAEAVGIRPLSDGEKLPHYGITVLGSDTIVAMASLTATMGWSSVQAGASSVAKALLVRRQALLVLAEDPKDSESFWNWSARQCRRLIFQDRGPPHFLVTTREGKASLAQQLKEQHPIRVLIRNVGGRTIEGRQTVLLFSETPAANEADYRLEAAATIDVRVPPLGLQLAELPLRYQPKPGRDVVLIADAETESAPLESRFTGERVKIPTCVDRLRNPKYRIPQKSLAHAVLSYADVANQGFQSLVEQRRVSGFTEKRLTLPIPGAESSLVISSSLGRAVSSTLYNGNSKQQGRSIFDAALAELRSACGKNAGEFIIEANSEATQIASFMIRTVSPDARLTLVFRNNIGDQNNGKYRVELDITALTFEQTPE